MTSTLLRWFSWSSSPPKTPDEEDERANAQRSSSSASYDSFGASTASQTPPSDTRSITEATYADRERRCNIIALIESDPELSAVRCQQKLVLHKYQEHKAVIAEIHDRHIQLRALKPVSSGNRPQQEWEDPGEFRFIRNEELANGSLSGAQLRDAVAQCDKQIEVLSGKIARARAELARLDDIIRSLRNRVRMLQAVVDAGYTVPEYQEHIRSLSGGVIGDVSSTACAPEGACTVRAAPAQCMQS